MVFLFCPCRFKGINVKAKTSSGTVREIQLYSGYYAMVIGVSDDVAWPDLPNAVKDAQDVAQTLKKMGFEVKIIISPSSDELKSVLNDMTYKYGRESNRALLFYYARRNKVGIHQKLTDSTFAMVKSPIMTDKAFTLLIVGVLRCVPKDNDEL